MSQIKWILPVITVGILMLTSCDSHTKSRFLYQKPEIDIYDTSGSLIDENAATYYNEHFCFVKMPYTEMSYSSNYKFSLIPSAYATRRDYDIKPLELITKLHVFTLNHYNTSFKAGDEVTDSCTFYLHNPTADSIKNPQAVISLADLITKFNLGVKNNRYNRNSSEYKPITESFSFRLKQPPSASGPQQFAVIFETATPSRFGDTSIIFTLNP
jgi:hypothetical protein